MHIAWAFFAGWFQCVWNIHFELHGTWGHAILVSIRKHWGMARFLWRARSW